VSAKAPSQSEAPPLRRTRAKRGEGERLREEILAAAERLLIKTGDVEAVSIRAVADAVGVTPPSIYLHFADKNELLWAVCERHFNVLDQVMERATAGIDDPIQSLVRRGRAYIQFGVENPEPYRILFMSKPAATPANFPPERMLQSASFGHLVEAVTRAIQEGDISGDPMLVSISLWATVHGITSLFISKPDFPWPDRERVIDTLLWIQIDGLATPKARRRLSRGSRPTAT
jgi:AcrR family transcriptional regulator